MASTPPTLLPFRIASLATSLFAKETGFSGPQLHDFFARYTDVLGPYQWNRSPSRWQIFQTGLRSLPLPQQRAVLLGRVDKGFGDVDARVWGHVA